MWGNQANGHRWYKTKRNTGYRGGGFSCRSWSITCYWSTSSSAAHTSSSAVQRSSTSAPIQTIAADSSPSHGWNLQPIFEQSEDEETTLSITIKRDAWEVWLELNWSSTTSNIDDLSFLCGLQTKNIKIKQVYVHTYYELVWGIQKLGSHWRIQVNFKKAKNEESSSSKGTYHSQFKNSLLDGILSYDRLPNFHSYLMDMNML